MLQCNPFETCAFRFYLLLSVPVLSRCCLCLISNVRNNRQTNERANEKKRARTHTHTHTHTSNQRPHRNTFTDIHQLATERNSIANENNGTFARALTCLSTVQNSTYRSDWLAYNVINNIMHLIIKLEIAMKMKNGCPKTLFSFPTQSHSNWRASVSFASLSSCIFPSVRLYVNEL